MARYLVRKSFVDVVGRLWMPMAIAASRIDVSSYDLEHMRDDDGTITRDSVEQWLMTHSGDFSAVLDFAASIEDGDNTVDIPWSTEDGEMQYADCMFPAED